MNILVKYVTAGLFFILHACSYPEDEKRYPVIDVGNAMESVADLRVSELGRTVDYVALETRDDALIGRYPNVAVWKDYILISSKDQPLMVFDKRDGHFCRTIGHIGNDPGGYATDGWGNVSCRIDGTKGTVYFPDWNPNGLLKYDMEGRFLGKVTLSSEKIPAPLPSMCRLHIANDTITIHNKYISRREDFLLLRFHGTDGKLLSAFPFRREIQPSNIEEMNYMYGAYVSFGGGVYQIHYNGNQRYDVTPDSPSLWDVDGEICLKESFVDTIYTVRPDTLIPRILLDLGKWRWPYEKRNESDRSSNKIAIDYMLENGNIIYFHFHTGLYERPEDCHSYCGIYDKRSGRTKVMKGEAMADDLNGFLPVTVEKVSSEGEFVGLLQMSDILEWKAQNGQSVQNPQIRSLLEKDEEDNPVVVLVR
jgi:hypothetical protein